MWFKEHNIIVRILEIPTTLVELDKNNHLLMEMVANILIEVYTTIAQAELEKEQSDRQKE